jgi:hypothetical protein
MSFIGRPSITIDLRTRRRIFSVLVLIAFCIATMGVSKKASAANIPIVVTQCSTCEDQLALQDAALEYFQTYTGSTPPGYAAGVVGPPSGLYCHSGNDYTVLLVVSSAVPMSGTFYTCWTVPRSTQVKGKLTAGLGGGTTPSVQTVLPISATTSAEAIAADNMLLHRSVPGGAISLPSTTLTWLNADAQELPLSLIPSQFVLVDTGNTVWHMLLGLLGIPQVTYADFTNLQTGQTFRIYANDTITVTDMDGYSAQVQWNPMVGNGWVYVPGSLRDPKGNPVPNSADNLPPAPTPTPGGSPQPPLIVSVPGGQTIVIVPWYNNPTPGGSVTVGPAPALPDGPPAATEPPPSFGCATLDCVVTV